MPSDPESITSAKQITAEITEQAHASFGLVGFIVASSVLALLLLFSALISGSEAAFFSLTPADKEDLKNDTDKKAGYVSQLLSKPKDLLATILITNNFVNVAIVILSSMIFTAALVGTNLNSTIRFILEVALITLVLLIIGEVIPKIYATKNAIRFSKMMGGALYFLNRIPPISWIRSILVKGSGYIQRKIGKGKVDISSDELEQALALTKDDGDSEEKHKILEGIVKFGNTEVRQIMKSRMDVDSIDAESTFEEVISLILEC
ncbi:MAG: CNNM domain-containing protein, partial [Crocinitomicaceae bacterium]|nr:CNNM domain-containing protein [Crocinitomicaceae bacterium]